MKGVVFTEYLDMLENRYGFEFVEDLIDECNLASGGAYTSVGTYEDAEMVSLMVKTSEKTGEAIPDLQKAFGHSMLQSFAGKYGHWIEDCKSGFDLLTKVDNYIHIEVRKLYPDAGLPKFDHHFEDDKTLVMLYSSPRKLSSLAEGLIEGTMIAFGHGYKIDKKMVEADGSKVEFTISIT